MAMFALLLLGINLLNVQSKPHNCSFSLNTDYHGITGHVIGRSNQSHCCQACTNDRRCHVAVLSSPTDDPPSECWLKFGALAKVEKEGVTACMPEGREYALVLVEDGDEDGNEQPVR